MKYNNRLLSILFAVLLGLVLINEWAFSSRKANTLDKSFPEINPEEVGKIEILASAESKTPYQFARQDSGWQLQRERMAISIDSEKPIGLLNIMQTLNIQGLASMEKDSWSRFELSDSTASEVKVYDRSDKLLAHLYTGKTGLIKGDKISYIREAGDDAVYAVRGPLAEKINQSFVDWRNDMLSNYLFPKQVVALSFKYPGDSSFTLSQDETTWFLGEEEADSVETTNYINLISNLKSQDFADAFQAKGKAPYSLSVQRSTGEGFTIEAYPGPEPDTYYLHSSLNEGSFFLSRADGLFEKFFVSRSTFE